MFMRPNRVKKSLFRTKSLAAVLVFGIAFCVAFTDLRAYAQGPQVVRDTEIENTIRVYSAPLFEAAGLDMGSVRIRLVLSQALNAFVAGGQRIFINTGLLTRAGNPSQVIGVLAHEIGHISGGHLSRIQEGLRNASTQSIIATVLGAAAAIAAGQPEGLAGAIIGGQALGQRTLFKYTQGMEQSADQAGVDFLERTGQSSKGLLEFLKILHKQSALYTDSRDPYASTHPLTLDRVRFLENHVAKSRFSNVPVSRQLTIMHARMRGKINGYVDDPARTLETYHAEDKGIEARYARAYAFMKLHKVREALAIVDQLITDSPKDPFFHELKGDILKDAGEVRRAIVSYRAAVKIIPWAALIRINLARMQLELNDPKLDDEVVMNIREALRYERELPIAWRQLATIYGRRGQTGKASLALAEEAMLRGDISRATLNAKRAIKSLPVGSPEHIRAQDIEKQVAQAKAKEDG
ncbi:MAG TPA: peptidase [Rhodospirillaceae bacterium]|nr:peptidase [Rhodospirillaceae bacterium]HAA92229.1 peptidase [Rhodospirillaceae bacterium]HAT36377.1 peptidase [Rhodospirillaceae bacterium]